MELLDDAIAELLAEDVVHYYLCLPPADGRLRARFYEAGAVVSERMLESGDFALEIRMQARDLNQLLGRAGITSEALTPLSDEQWLDAVTYG